MSMETKCRINGYDYLTKITEEKANRESYNALENAWKM